VSSVLVSNITSAFKSPLLLKKCSSFSSKLAGLMFQKNISENYGIILMEKKEGKISTSIHMFFMNFDIGVIWLNQKKQVVDIRIAKKWHPYYASKEPAQFTLEIHPSRLKDFHLRDQIELSDED
jgi:uncharacterized membrane protein (UPF0127 family)